VLNWKSGQHAVTLFDACDPETFNAALGPETCTRSGVVQFEKFLEQVRLHHSIGAWHCAPPNVTMRVGQRPASGEMTHATQVVTTGAFALHSPATQ
jgi:hypothetical protein